MGIRVPQISMKNKIFVNIGTAEDPVLQDIFSSEESVEIKDKKRDYKNCMNCGSSKFKKTPDGYLKCKYCGGLKIDDRSE